MKNISFSSRRPPKAVYKEALFAKCITDLMRRGLLRELVCVCRV